MILAFDTYYYADNTALTICIAFQNWNDAMPGATYNEQITGIAGYEPGEFYKRELPCILSLWETIPHEDIEAIIVDGFVYLDDDLKYGLGGHLYEALGRKIPVIGVAKTNFATIINQKASLVRGDSKKPLYITAVGINLSDAVAKIDTMHGAFRIPTLLKMLDRLTKGN